MDFYAEKATSKSMRNLSKAVFGQELRLALCVYIARSLADPFTLSEAAAALGVPPSALQAPMGSLMDAGLVNRTVSVPGMRERWLRGERSAIWALSEELLNSDPPNQLMFTFEA